MLVALLGAMLFKYARIYRHPVIELCLLVSSVLSCFAGLIFDVLQILYAYSSYLLAEGLDLSGIVAILFCGMVRSLNIVDPFS